MTFDVIKWIILALIAIVTIAINLGFIIRRTNKKTEKI